MSSENLVVDWLTIWFKPNGRSLRIV